MRKLITAVLALGATGLMLAQDQSEAEQKRMREMELKTATAGTVAQTFEFVSREMVGGNPVKGAPYSAQAVTETTQTLADGNRISRSSSSMLYRDSQGRERREESLKAIGSFNVQGQPAQTVFISDPVAGVNYSLEMNSHVAHKMPQMFSRANNVEKSMAEARAKAGAEAVRIQTNTVAIGGTAGGEAWTYVTNGSEKADVKSEDLGTMMIEGVQAQGTRVTRTIPAGQIGNERPLQTVSERWYSPELKVMVMTKNSDPRNGETIYKLTNINRSEPPSLMFEVPADFTISDSKDRVFRIVAPLKKEEN